MSQNVYTLLCERDLPMALITVPNILKFLEPTQKLIVVDDGSLTQKSINQLESLSINLIVITRKTREEMILEKIKDYPACIKFREELPLAFKLIDIPLLVQGESSRFTYTDSDIIYLKHCTPYFNTQQNTHLRTDGIKISVKLRNAILKYNWLVPFKFNSGYFSYNADDFDMGFINYYLSLPDVRNIPWLIEQTGWALLFGQKGNSYYPLEKQFVCRGNFDGPQPDTLAVHLIGQLKRKCKEWSISDTLFEEPNLQPEFEKSRNVTFMDWVKKSFNRLTI